MSKKGIKIERGFCFFLLTLTIVILSSCGRILLFNQKKNLNIKFGDEIVRNGNFSQNHSIKRIFYKKLSEDSHPGYSARYLPDEVVEEFFGEWTIFIHPSIEAKYEISDNTFILDINHSEKDPSKIQLCQFPIPVNFGNSYLISFEAKADTPRKIYFSIERIDDGHPYSKRLSFQIYTEWQKYEEIFTTYGTDYWTRLQFSLATERGKIYLRNISLKPTME